MISGKTVSGLAEPQILRGDPAVRAGVPGLLRQLGGLGSALSKDGETERHKQMKVYESRLMNRTQSSLTGRLSSSFCEMPLSAHCSSPSVA